MLALLPACRNGTLSRPGPQAPARWDPFAEFEDLHHRVGQLLGGAPDGGESRPLYVRGYRDTAARSATR